MILSEYHKNRGARKKVEDTEISSPSNASSAQLARVPCAKVDVSRAQLWGGKNREMHSARADESTKATRPLDRQRGASQVGGDERKKQKAVIYGLMVRMWLCCIN